MLSIRSLIWIEKGAEMILSGMLKYSFSVHSSYTIDFEHGCTPMVVIYFLGPTPKCVRNIRLCPFIHFHANTVYPKKYAHGFCFAVLCCGYTLTDFPISIGLTSLALWQSNDCPSASKATLMNKDKYFMWIHYERLRNYNKAKHNKTVCIFLGIYCMLWQAPHGKQYRKTHPEKLIRAC